MGLMEYLFGGTRKTSAELLQENKRMLTRSIRELDRESNRLEREEQKTIADMKRNAKEGHTDAVRSMARNLVQSRQYRKKFRIMRANIQAVALKVQGMKSQDAMNQAVISVTRVVSSMNRQMNLPLFQHLTREFERQTDMMDLKEEMVEDAIGSVMENDGEEEETGALVQQVLDELGIELKKEADKEPASKNVMAAKSPVTRRPMAIGISDADLQARLENLKCNF